MNTLFVLCQQVGNVDGYDNTRYLWNDGDGYGPLDEDLR